MAIGYTEGEIVDGIQEARLDSWHFFHDYIRKEFLNFPHYVWRGQRDAAWPLQSSLDREFASIVPSNPKSAAKTHLERFKLATRGRRGSNPARDLGENEWWALAQHNGMSTPLLDWTESPFVALYFAFAKQEASASGNRAVWIIGPVDDRNREIAKADDNGRPRTLDYVRPQQDENPRLVSQAGLFTRVPIGQTVEQWIREHYQGDSEFATLVKIVIPDKERIECLKTLNRMNINHLSLFPDLYGAGKHCNNALFINKY